LPSSHAQDEKKTKFDETASSCLWARNLWSRKLTITDKESFAILMRVRGPVKLLTLHAIYSQITSMQAIKWQAATQFGIVSTRIPT
jgi:hypothetical protein